MWLLFAIAGLSICTGLILYLIVSKYLPRLGILSQLPVYSDTPDKPGDILYSKTIPLCGKPDYIVKQNGHFLPVEVKTGKTPAEPHISHTMQLMAYCYLVEERYGLRPPGGYIKYPKREFKIKYTDLAHDSVKLAVSEILAHKKSPSEIHCNHKFHYV